jgi:hypothetical protein
VLLPNGERRVHRSGQGRNDLALQTVSGHANIRGSEQMRGGGDAVREAPTREGTLVMGHYGFPATSAAHASACSEARARSAS